MPTQLNKFLAKIIYNSLCSSYLTTFKNTNHASDNDISLFWKSKIRDILEHTVTSSPYYKNRLEENLIQRIGSSDWNKAYGALPFLEKENLRDCAREQIKVPDIKGYLRETTGTTGTPVRVWMDHKTLCAQLAARLHFFDWHGIGIGAPEARFWGRTEKVTLRSRMKEYLLNRRVFQLDSRNPTRVVEDLSALRSWNPSYFYGYASLLLKTAEYMDNNKWEKPHPKVIISTAEMLTESQREYISSVFGCPVVQEYGCSEVDIIAFECPHGRYHLNYNRLYVEFPPAGGGNNEVVVTDLDNRCTPLLRYRLGDIAELDASPCPCGRPATGLKRIVGRTANQLVSLPNGGFFHAVKFAHLIEKLCANNHVILQYRVDHIKPTKIIFRLHGEIIEHEKDNISLFLAENTKILFNCDVDTEIVFGKIENYGKHTYYVKHFK